MPLFQDFGKRVSDVAKNVGQKTAEAAEVARLNNRIASKEAEIEQFFLQIGKAYYSMRGAGGACEAADLFCQKVTQLEAECEATRKEIDLLRHQSRCPNCGGVQPIEASFCASCGTKLPRPVRPEPAPQPEPEPEQEPEPEPEPEAPPEPEPPQTMTAGGAEIIWPSPSHAPEAPAPEAPAPEAPVPEEPTPEVPAQAEPKE
jgi:hypothetical protein